MNAGLVLDPIKQDTIKQQEWVEIRQASQQTILSEGIEKEDLLLPYQKKPLQLLETTSVLVVEKSRRIGFTWALAAYAVLRAARNKKSGGYDVMYISYSQEMTREFIDACSTWARAFALASSNIGEFMFDDVNENKQSDTRQIKAFRIQFASGFEIIALSSAPRSLRGKQGCVIIDEAAFVDSLAEVLKSAMAFLMWGGQVIVVSTHNGSNNAFCALVDDIRKGRKPYSLIRVDFDEALKDGLYKRICLVTGKTWSVAAEAQWREEIIAFYGDDAMEELYCIPTNGTGIFLSAPLIEERMFDAPILKLSLPQSFFSLPNSRKIGEIAAWCEENIAPVIKATIDKNLRSSFGMDVGRYSDLSIIAPMQISRTLCRIVPFLIELEKVPFAQQKQIASFILKNLPRRVGAMVDATGIGAGIAEDLVTENGAERISITREWYREEMPPLKAAFEDGQILIPRSSDILADLRAFKMVGGIVSLPAIRTKTESGGTRHGDAGIAIALAYSATRKTREVYAYESISRKSENLDDDDENFSSSIFGIRGSSIF